MHKSRTCWRLAESGTMARSPVAAPGRGFGSAVTALRLVDVLASFSLVSDLGFGLPPGESLRSAVIATTLARRLGLDEAAVGDVLYTTLLQHLGCAGFAHETATVYGDELRANAALAKADPSDPRELVGTFIRATVRGRPPLEFARIVGYTLLRGDRFGAGFARARCEVGRETARRLALPTGAQRGLHEVAETWTGGGLLGLRGPAIAPAARLANVAATVARADAMGGPPAAVDTVQRRAGRILDPDVVAAFIDDASTILDEVRAADPRDVILVLEPTPHATVRPEDLPVVAGVLGDVADLKSVFTLGHAAGVAGLAASAAGILGLAPAVVERVHVAGAMHDIGRVGVSTGVWERPGPLTTADAEQVRLHAYHSERILRGSSGLEPYARLVGQHHERLDGSGYHRGAGRRDLRAEDLVLAAADVFQARTQERPHRPAVTAAEAADHLASEVRDGRLDAEAARAVCEAADVRGRRLPRPARPAGLSDREVEVLRLVAGGLSNREIATRLSVSPRTAEHHVQHIYDKIGTASRAAAALFAMEHDLLE
jgi:DNA-binding CsgD family transcriptional regulator